MFNNPFPNIVPFMR